MFEGTFTFEKGVIRKHKIGKKCKEIAISKSVIVMILIFWPKKGIFLGHRLNQIVRKIH